MSPDSGEIFSQIGQTQIPDARDKLRSPAVCPSLDYLPMEVAYAIQSFDGGCGWPFGDCHCG